MAIKDIIDTAVGAGKSAVTRGREVAERRLRGDKDEKDPSGSPSSVGAARPGEAGGPKSATTRKAKPRKAKPKAKAKAKAKPTAKKRAAATRAAATSGKDVSEAAKKA
jgi:hypothetical protein